jgi:hypothetical protein
VPHVKHVFIIVLENENESSTFGTDTKIPYLANTLTAAGAFVPNYYATGHASLDNYIAMISGQGPNIQTQSDCQFFSNFTALSGPDSNGQYVNPMGGCVYPPGAQNIATQLESNGNSWRAYMQDMANSGPAQPATCRHPAINSQEAPRPPSRTTSTRPGTTCSSTSTRSSICPPARPTSSTSAGWARIWAPGDDPDYSFIHRICNDGHDTPCIDGGPGGMVQPTSSRTWCPRSPRRQASRTAALIVRSMRPGGLERCCGEQLGPNT